MKKHLLGFAIFSLILGTAIFVAALARSARQPAESPSSVSVEYNVSKQSCWKMNRRANNSENSAKSSIKITQAVFNEKTGKMNLSFAVERETPATQDISVRLSFVNGVSEENGKWDSIANYELMTFVPNFNVENKATFTFPYTFRWNKNIKSTDNLYVTADLIDGKSNSLNTVFIPKKMSDFTPVLITDKNF